MAGARIAGTGEHAMNLAHDFAPFALVLALPLLAPQAERSAPERPARGAAARAAEEDDATATATLPSADVPDRAKILVAAGADAESRARIQDGLPEAAGGKVKVDDVVQGKVAGDGTALSVEQLRSGWYHGFVVDAENPVALTHKGLLALRMSTNSVRLGADYSLRDMLLRKVLRLKANAGQPLLRLAVGAPKPKSGKADTFVVTIGVATGSGAPFRVELNGAPVPFSVSPYGIQIVASLGEGLHLVDLVLTKQGEGSAYEYRYAAAHRL